MKRFAITGIAFLGLTAGCDAPPATGPYETTLATDVVAAATAEIVVPITLDCDGAHSWPAPLPETAPISAITLTGTAAPVVTRQWSTTTIDDGPILPGGVIFDGTRFLATGGTGCPLCGYFASVWESTDGASWNQIARIDGIPYWRDIIHTGSHYVAGGYPGRLWVSEDGVTWLPEPGGAHYNVIGPRSFAWDGDRTVVVLGNRLGYSADGGATFTPITQVLFDNAWYGHGVIWDGHQFIAYFGVPYGHPDYPGTMIATSPDGIQWTEHHTHQSALPMVLIWMATDGAGRFLAYNNHWTAMTSTDGLDWTPAPPSVPVGRYAWDNGEIVSYRGGIFSSADGLNWQRECTGGVFDAYDLASGNGRRVVVGIPYYTPGGTPLVAAVSDLTRQPNAELSLEMQTYTPNSVKLLSRQLLEPTDAGDPRLAPGSTIAFPPFIGGRVATFTMPVHAAEGSAVLSGAFDVRVRYREVRGG